MFYSYYGLYCLVLYFAIADQGVSDSLTACGCNTDDRSETLQSSHVFYRHGPRTPIPASGYSTYPSDPYDKKTYEPYGLGQLTNKGKQEVYKLGKDWRQLYSNLLGDYYTDEVILFMSTPMARTLMTSQLIAAAMFPPHLTPMSWNEDLNWQPVPVYTYSDDIVKLLAPSSECPALKNNFEKVMQLPEVQSELQQLQPLFQNLSDLTGSSVNSTFDVLMLYSILKAQEEYGLELPEWTKDYYPLLLDEVSAKTYTYYGYTKEMQRFQAGFFLKQVVDGMQQHMDGSLQPPERKLFMYCVHDWNVEHILVALDVRQPLLPEFTASIMMELHQNPLTGIYYVQIYYRYDPEEQTKEITIPGCEFKCEFDKFMELIAEVLPDGTFDELCEGVSD